MKLKADDTHTLTSTNNKEEVSKVKEGDENKINKKRDGFEIYNGGIRVTSNPSEENVKTKVKDEVNSLIEQAK
jgi:hypothetical protein